MNDMIYIPADIRSYWEPRGGREAMIEFLRHSPFILTKCMEALPKLEIYLENKPVLKEIIEVKI